jgi:hypothetical protein
MENDLRCDQIDLIAARYGYGQVARFGLARVFWERLWKAS